jgi:Cd2+/Zn2+-exporting ATPase
MELSPAIRMIGATLQRQGKTVMLVVRRSRVEDTLGADRDWEVMGYIAVADVLRTEAAESVRRLRANGIQRVAMMTGDNQAAADYIARQAGIDEVYANLLPEHKLELVKKLREQHTVAMIGDGVNDAPALATAQVGIAMGAGGTDVALETADVVLMSSDLGRLPFTLQLSRKANQIIRQNVIFSIGVIVLLVLSTILAPIVWPGFLLPLPLGVVGHEGSTLVVVLNGLRMLRLRPHCGPAGEFSPAGGRADHLYFARWTKVPAWAVLTQSMVGLESVNNSPTTSRLLKEGRPVLVQSGLAADWV